VVVLSHALFIRRFAGDTSIVGRVIELDHQPVTVVGIMRPGLELRLFEGRREPGLYAPKYYEDFESRVRASGYWNVIARLREDVTPASAAQELSVLSSQLARDFPRTNRTIEAEVVPLRDLQRRIWAIDPQQAFYETATIESMVSRTLVGRQFSVFLLTAFGVAVLALASAGLYGVLSCSTSQRTRELASGSRSAPVRATSCRWCSA